MGRATSDRDRLYDILAGLRAGLPAPTLSALHGKLPWPARGVYCFFEPGEFRPDGTTPRVVRIGTHGLTQGSGTTLWGRLSQHRGTASTGGGNHRGSVFRLHVGSAILTRPGCTLTCTTWAKGSNAPKAVKAAEHALESAVSAHINAMPFVWVAADDAPGPGSLRGYLESNLIALLSRIGPAGSTADPPSERWLGHHCASEKVRRSGLWNVRHVDDATYDPQVLAVLEECARKTRPLNA